jgi:molecular chaperone DnaJ
MDYYQVFDLPKTATQDEITKKYRVLAKQYHPDRNPGDKAAEDKFKEISAAYDVIGDPEKRSFYDAHGHAPGRRSAPPPPRPSTVQASDFYKSVFNTFFGGDVSGRHVQVRLEIDLEDTLKDIVRNVTYSKRKTCPTCRGCGASSFKPCGHCLGSGQVTKTENPPFVFTGPCPHCQGQGKTDAVRCGDCSGSGYSLIKDCNIDVKIPAGIDQGMQVRVRGAGEAGSPGEPPGDLFVVVLIKKHEFFSREGANLTIEIPVSYSTLVAGGEILIPTLDKTFMSVKVPPGTQNGTRFRLKGRGMPDIQKPKNTGDILASVKLEVPQGVDDEYKELIEKLREVEAKNPSPRVKAYSDRVK